MRKLFSTIFIAILIVLNTSLVAFGQNIEQPTTRTLLPETRITSNFQCTKIMKRFQEIYNFEVEDDNLGSLERFFDALEILNSDPATKGLEYELTQDDILGCAIITGRISLSYLSLFIYYILNWLSIATGVVSMFFIILGGYKYIIGSISENKDAGKKTILYAIIGLLVSTGAWIVVNIVQGFVSS